jgi:5-methylcytosine-specific restriction endonuclease McrA
MPSPKPPCPGCGQPMHPKAQMCRKCKPTYVRTAESRAAMSKATAGNPKPWLRGLERPDHSQTMKDWWTPERREAKRQEMLKRNPDARYHGLSAKAAARLVASVGHCQRCDHDGSESRLGVHHRDRDKHNQSPENLEVLCHRCHMREHARTGETGWDSYHRKRKMNLDSTKLCRHPAAPGGPRETP